MSDELIRINRYEVVESASLVDALLSFCEFLHEPSDVLNLCSSSLIRCNGELIFTSIDVSEGDVIELLTPQRLEPEVNENIELLYEDEYFYAVGKPSQLPVHPSGKYYFNTLSSLISRKWGLVSLHPYNRLDRETSGIVIFAKKPEYIVLLQNSLIDKWYYALVFGKLTPAQGVIKQPLLQKTVGNLRHHMVVDQLGREAKTTYEVLSSTSSYSFVELKLHTGRKHQIRVHLAYLGHPIVGDKQYGLHPELVISHGKNLGLVDGAELMKKVGATRQLLHCHKVEFKHPIEHKLVSIEHNIGKYFLDFLNKENIELNTN